MLANRWRWDADGEPRMNTRGRPQESGARHAAAAQGDWTEHEEHYLRTFRDAPYYSSGRSWMDYAPAYRYGYERYVRFAGRHFEDVETDLQSDWEAGRAASRLAWAEARGPIRDIWRRLEQDAPGDPATPAKERRR